MHSKHSAWFMGLDSIDVNKGVIFAMALVTRLQLTCSLILVLIRKNALDHGIYNQEEFIFCSFGALKPKVKELTCLVSAKGFSSRPLFVFSHGRRDKEVLLGCFHMDSIPIHKLVTPKGFLVQLS